MRSTFARAVCLGLSLVSAMASRADAEPTWAFRAESLMLWRTTAASQPLFDAWDPETATVTGPALDTDQLASGMAAGPKLSLMRVGDDGYGWEAAWLRVQSFTSDRSLPTTDQGYAIAEGTSIYGNTFAFLDSASVQTSSAIQSFEWLARLPSSAEWLVWTTGFRWVEWRDAVQITDRYFLVDEHVDRYGTATINSLYGLQIGADATIWRPNKRFSIDGVAKAGLYGNNAAQSSAFTTNDTGAVETLSVATSTARAGFVGEVGITGVWRFTDRLAARLGYTAFWLGGLATAPKQLPAQELIFTPPPDAPTVAGATNTGSSVFLQGLTLGLEARW